MLLWQKIQPKTLLPLVQDSWNPRSSAFCIFHFSQVPTHNLNRKNERSLVESVSDIGPWCHTSSVMVVATTGVLLLRGPSTVSGTFAYATWSFSHLKQMMFWSDQMVIISFPRINPLNCTIFASLTDLRATALFMTWTRLGSEGRTTEPEPNHTRNPPLLPQVEW